MELKKKTTSCYGAFIAVVILFCGQQLYMGYYQCHECLEKGFIIPVQSSYVLVSDTPREFSEAMAAWNSTRSKSRYLQDRLQVSFASVQYPTSCNGAKFFICDLLGLRSGYGSRMQHVITCHMMAYSLGRILLLKDAYLEGWEEFVVPLESNETCKQGEEPEVRLINHMLWNDEWQFNNAPTILAYNVFDAHKGFIPPSIPGTAPKRFADILETEGIDPVVWYIGQSAHFLSGRFQPSFVEQVKQLKAELGLSHPMVGLQIRHSDKVFGPHRESDYISALDYMVPVEKFFNELHPEVAMRNVFVATDDPGAISALKGNFTNGYRFIGSNVAAAEAGEADHNRFYKSSLMHGLMTDLAIITACEFVVCTLSSNVGRIIHELRQAMFIEGRSLRNQLVSMDSKFCFFTYNYQYSSPRLILVAKRDIKAHNNGTMEFADLTKGAWYEVNAKVEKQNDTFILLGGKRGYARREDVLTLATRTELRDRQLLREIDYLMQMT